MRNANSLGSTRVLHVLNALNCGGAETMVMNLFRNMAEGGFIFDFVLQTDEKCFYSDEVRSLGGRIFSSPKFTMGSVGSYGRWWNAFLDEHREYGIVHGHNNGPAAFYLAAAKRHGVVTVAHSHSTVFGDGLEGLAKTVLQRPVRRIADLRLACSHEAGLALYGSKASFDVLPNGVDFGRFSFNSADRAECREELEVPAEAIALISVARFAKTKNQTFLIDVLRKLADRGCEAYAVFAGDGELRALCEAYATELGVASRCRFLGVRRDTPRLLSAADVFCMPSLYEGLPVSAVEAQASGLRLLLSDQVSSEAAIGGDVMFLPIDEPAIWADAIDGATAETCSRRVVEGLDRKFNCADSAAWLAGCYRELLGMRSEGRCPDALHC